MGNILVTKLFKLDDIKLTNINPTSVNIICVLENGNGKDLTDTVDDNKKDFELLEKYLQQYKEIVLE